MLPQPEQDLDVAHGVADSVNHTLPDTGQVTQVEDVVELCRSGQHFDLNGEKIYINTCTFSLISINTDRTSIFSCCLLLILTSGPLLSTVHHLPKNFTQVMSDCNNQICCFLLAEMIHLIEKTSERQWRIQGEGWGREVENYPLLTPLTAKDYFCLLTKWRY